MAAAQLNALEKERETTLKIIGSTLTSVKDKFTLNQLHSDYKQIVGSSIPYEKYGYATLYDFLKSAPKLVRLSNRGGTQYVETVGSAALQHMNKLVEEQRRPKAKQRPNVRRPNFSSYWRGRQMAPSGTRKPVHERLSYTTANNYGSRPSNPIRPSRPNFSNKFSNCNGAPPIRPTKPHISNSQISNRNTNSRPQSYTSTPIPPLRNDVPFDWSWNTDTAPPVPEPPKFVREEKSKAPLCFKDTLIIETKKLEIDKLQFKTIPWGKKNRFWLSTITVKGQKFSSYPLEAKSAAVAEEAVSEEALGKLKDLQSSDELKITTDFMSASERILKILDDEPEGLWLDALKKKYSKIHNEHLSSDWVNEAIAHGITGLIVTQINEDRWIFNRQYTIEVEEIATERICPEPQQDRIQPTGHESLEEDMYSVFVTFIKDTSSIAFRLLDNNEENPMAPFEEMVTDMEMFYLEEKNRIPVQDWQIGGYYIYSHDTTWSRVQLRRINVTDKEVLVYFLDHGDEEVLPCSKLYQLHNKYLSLPFQCRHCSLAGLEFCAEVPEVIEELITLAFGKSLIVEVSAREPSLSVTLWDTSTDEDININERLLQILAKSCSLPQLPNDGSVCEVYVSHVTNCGDVYVKIESQTYKILESLMEATKKRVAEFEKQSAVTVDMNKLYLAKFSETGEWHRAVPRCTNQDAQMVLMKFVDIGATESTASSCIIPLEAVSNRYLSQIPHQAIKCHLDNVPPTNLNLHWTQAVTNRLTSMLPSGEPLLLKVQKDKGNSSIPMVELFKRLQPQNELISINASLAFDTSLFRREDKNNNQFETEGNPLRKSNSDYSSLACLAKSPGTYDEPERDTKKSSSCPPTPSASLLGETFTMKEIPQAEIPVVDGYFDVFVTYAANPSNFVVQPWKKICNLDEIMDEMSEFYSRPKNLMPIRREVVGGYYALLDTDDIWYRVRVEHTAGQMVSVLKVDYGGLRAFSSLEALQPLWPRFRELPRQAFVAKLGGVLPKNLDWRPEDACRFRDLVEKQAFVSKVVAVHTDKANSPVLELKLIDTKDPHVDIYIDQILIEEGIAKQKK